MSNVINLKKPVAPQPTPPTRPTVEGGSTKYSSAHVRPLHSERKPAMTQPIQRPSLPAKVVPATAPVTTPMVKKDSGFTWTTHLQQAIRRPRMLWLIGIVLVGASLLALLQSSVLLFVFIGLVFILTLVQRSKEPRASTITISDAGIRIDGTTKFWKDMSSFWVEYNPGGLKELSIEPAKWHLPYLKIPLDDTDPMKIRNHLIVYLPEKEHELSLIDAFLKGK